MASLPVPPARGHRDGMSKAEVEYAQELEFRRLGGEIADWGYERITFRLADRTRYTPDFDVLYPDGRFELVEIKATWTGGGKNRAGWTKDSKIKFKVARESFPMFTFRAFRKLPKREGAGFEEVM